MTEKRASRKEILMCRMSKEKERLIRGLEDVIEIASRYEGPCGTISVGSTADMAIDLEAAARAARKAVKKQSKKTRRAVRDFFR